MMQLITAFDEGILLFLQENVRFGLLNSLMRGITALGNAGAVWIAVAILLLCIRRYRKCGVVMLASLLFCTLINTVIFKNLVQRARPFDVIPELTILIKRPSGFSFPSGHASTSFACAWAIMGMKMERKFAVCAFILATLIAFSRVYVGVHYPTDVIAGAVVGIICGITVCRGYRRFFEGKLFAQKGESDGKS